MVHEDISAFVNDFDPFPKQCFMIPPKNQIRFGVHKHVGLTDKKRIKLVLVEEILHQSIVSLSHYLQGI